MLKKEARKLFREKRNALTDIEQSKLDDLMLIQFQTIDLPFLHAALSYWPIEENKEPNTHLFTEFLRFRNPELKIAYPVSDFETITKAVRGITDEAKRPCFFLSLFVRGIHGEKYKVIKTIVSLTIAQRDALSEYFIANVGRRLLDELDRATTGYFG